MNWQPPRINLVLAWIWVFAGFGSGAILGMGFRGKNWLGGYASLRRRLYRLAHISFFGLGVLNLMFYLTVSHLALQCTGTLVLASWGFVIGALTMPACCIAVAHLRKLHPMFIVPVASLMGGALATLAILLRS